MKKSRQNYVNQLGSSTRTNTSWMSMKKSWQNYVNQLGSSTRINTPWMSMRKISGKIQPTAFKHLMKNKTEATIKKGIADINWDIFRKFFHQQLQSTFPTERNKNLISSPIILKNTTNPLHQQNYKKLLKHHTTQQSVQMKSIMKHLPKNSLDYLLTIFNDIRINSKFPNSWKIATITPIPKPGKDGSNPAITLSLSRINLF